MASEPPNEGAILEHDELLDDEAQPEGEGGADYDPILDWVDPSPNKSLEQLEAELVAARKVNGKQSREIDMFTSYLERYALLNPEEMEKDEAGDAQQEEDSKSTRGGRKGSNKHSSRRGKNARQSTRGNKTNVRPWMHTLSASEKCLIANKEIEHVGQENATSEGKAMKQQAQVRAEIEVNETILGEIVKGLMDLMKDFSKHNTPKILSGTEPEQLTKEKVVRQHQELIKTRSNLIQKITLRTSSLRSQLRVTEASLKQKEISGEDLHAVDFERLKIENSEFVEKLVARNADLLRLKQKLIELGYLNDSFLDEIKQKGDVLRGVQKDISAVTSLMGAIAKEEVTVKTETVRVRKANAKSEKRLQNFKAPPVLSYVKQKETIEKVAYQNHLWARRVKIAEANHKRTRTTWRTFVRYQEFGDADLYMGMTQRILPPILDGADRHRSERTLSGRDPLPPLGGVR